MSSSRAEVVMVVDDDEGARELVDIVLSQGGFTVIPLTAAKHACDILEKTPPAAIVLDINMPEMSGLDLLNWMNRRGMRIPVVVATACGDRDTVADAMRAGAAEFLLKPFEPGELVKRVRSALQAAAAAAADLPPDEADAIFL